jgi:hypothetical protein
LQLVPWPWEAAAPAKFRRAGRVPGRGSGGARPWAHLGPGGGRHGRAAGTDGGGHGGSAPAMAWARPGQQVAHDGSIGSNDGIGTVA